MDHRMQHVVLVSLCKKPPCVYWIHLLITYTLAMSSIMHSFCSASWNTESFCINWLSNTAAQICQLEIASLLHTCVYISTVQPCSLADGGEEKCLRMCLIAMKFHACQIPPCNVCALVTSTLWFHCCLQWLLMCPTLSEHPTTHGLQCLGCEAMTFKSQQRAFVRYVYEVMDVFLWLSIGFGISKSGGQLHCRTAKREAACLVGIVAQHTRHKQAAQNVISVVSHVSHCTHPQNFWTS